MHPTAPPVQSRRMGASEALEAAALEILADLQTPGRMLRQYSLAFNARSAADARPCPFCFLANWTAPNLRVLPSLRAGWGLARCRNGGCRAEFEFKAR